MRVHLGSDHAGLELKQHLIDWLRDHGHEPVDHGPFVYDAAGRLPGLLPACRGRASPPTRLDSLGVVIGGSGNGEQIAANKVTGVRAALVWNEETAVLARQHNDANVISVGGRMHTVDEMTRFVELFLDTPFTGEERHVRRIGDAGRLRATGDLPPLPDVRPGARHDVTGPMPEGHTLHRLATALGDTFAGRPVRVSSPQGRFADRGRSLDGATLLAAESAGKHLFLDFDADRRRPRPPRALSAGSTCTAGSSRCRRRSARSGSGWCATTRRTPTCAAPPRARCVTGSTPRRDRGQARPRPAAPRRRPRPGLAADLAQPARRSPTC